jgi:hypothetical protein
VDHNEEIVLKLGPKPGFEGIPGEKVTLEAFSKGNLLGSITVCFFQSEKGMISQFDLAGSSVRSGETASTLLGFFKAHQRIRELFGYVGKANLWLEEILVENGFELVCDRVFYERSLEGFKIDLDDPFEYLNLEKAGFERFLQIYEGSVKSGSARPKLRKRGGIDLSFV